MICTVIPQSLLLSCNGEKKRGFKEHATLGEAVCDGVIVNFLKEKEHLKCSCSSVYYNAVF